jgi:D-glycero-D-manno-heptose 1,7-bisphosphate phosphatase
MTQKHRAIFVDKDGTLVHDVPYSADPAQIQLLPGAAEGLSRLHAAGYLIVIVSNQSGVARGHFTEDALPAVERKLHAILQAEGISLTGFYYCPHYVGGVVPEYAIECACRKPQPGMLRLAAHERSIDLAASWMIGDRAEDVEAGRRAGCRTIWIPSPTPTAPEASRAHHRAADLAEAAGLILDGPSISE